MAAAAPNSGRSAPPRTRSMLHRQRAAHHGRFQHRRGILRRPQLFQADLEQGEGSLLQKCLLPRNRAPSRQPALTPFIFGPLPPKRSTPTSASSRRSSSSILSNLEHVFIRGSRVRFMIIPDMLKNAPMLKRLEARIRAAGGRGGGPPVGGGRGGAPPVRR